MIMLLAHDHAELDRLLAVVLAGLAARDFDRSFSNLDLFWARLAMHIRAENVRLFPALVKASEKRRLGQAGLPTRNAVREIIAWLRADHDFFMSELTAAIKQLRDLPESDRQTSTSVFANVREQVLRIQERLDAHNKLEETQVYFWAGAFLDDSEQRALNEELQGELTRFPSRFDPKKM